MGAIRTLIRSRHGLALWLIAMALAVKALVPAGYMVAPAKGLSLTLTVCSAMSGKTMTVTLPMDETRPQPDKTSGKVQNEACPFGALGHAAAPGADPVLLVAAILFVLALGFAPQILPALRQRSHARPPLRGPPALA